MGSKMHVLVMPSENFVGPMGGIFQRHLAHALKLKCDKVGVLSAGFVPFHMLFDAYPYLSFENEDGVNVYRRYIRLVIPGRIANEVYFRRLVGVWLKLFEKYLREQGRPDIIHAHNCLYAGLAALKIKEKYGIPYLITEHSSAFARRLVTRRQAELVRVVLNHADAITVVSTAFGKLLRTMFALGSRPVTTIYNVLDGEFEKNEAAPQALHRKRNMFTFAHIANLVPEKNQSDLLRAFADKFKGDNLFQLRIGGDGPMRRSLERHSRELGIKKQVGFLGRLDRGEVLREMCNCDAFVLSSVVETFGVVLLEALACGKPIVATRCGGPEEIVTRDNGMLVPAKDPAALAEAMQSIFLNIDKYDANHIRNDCLARFGREAFLKRLLDIYRRILDNKTQGDSLESMR